VRTPRDLPRSAHHLKVINFLIFKLAREQIHCPYSCTPVVAEAGAVEVEDEVVRRIEVVVIASDDEVEDEVEEVDDTEVLVGQAMETHSLGQGHLPVGNCSTPYRKSIHKTAQSS
jgi:hypothetical protein